MSPLAGMNHSTKDPVDDIVLHHSAMKEGPVDLKRSPVLQLPTEITSLIFTHAVAFHYYSPSCPADEWALWPEVLVSHVCRQWRFASLAYPRLWTNFLRNSTTTTQATLARFAAYLERAKNELLNLWFEFPATWCSFDFPKDRRERSKLLSQATHQVQRWNSFTLKMMNGFFSSINQVFWLETISAAPNLKHYSVCFGRTADWFEFPDDLGGRICQHGAPKLKSVKLDSSILLGIAPPLSNVTTLRLEVPYHEPHRDLPLSWPLFVEMVSLPNLENLSVDGNVPDGPDLDRNATINMKNLKHLRFSGQQNMGCVLPQLTAPLLQSLVIRDDWFPEDVNLSTSDVQHKPFPSLRILSLIQPAHTPPESVGYLAQLTSSAMELILCENEDTNILAVLTDLPTPGESFWPKLRTITCNFDPESFDKLENLISLLEGRARGSDICVRILPEADELWSDCAPMIYDALKQYSTVEVIGRRDPLWHGYWPPDELELDHFFDSADPFRIQPFSE